MAGPAPFLFGKLPAHGDFIMRGLSQSARQAWDDWASDLMRRMIDVHGEGFEAWHDGAPPWRFVAGGGAFGADWLSGALAPSIDSAGRRFLVVLGVQGLTPAGAASLGLPIAEALEQLIYHAIGSGLDADAAVAAISAQLDELASAAAEVVSGLDARPTAPGVWWSAHDPRPVLAAAPPPREVLEVVYSSLEGAL